jgi:hypothetical protein
MVRKVHLLATAICAISACRSAGHVEPEIPEPVSAPAASPERPPTSTKSWELHPAIASRRYHVTSISLLELGGIRDSINSEIHFTLNSQPQDTAILFSGTVDSISVQNGSHIGPGTRIKLPIAFSGHFGHNSVILTTPAGCNEERISLESIIPHVLTHFPHAQIAPGSTWTDSTTVSTCTGEIPTTDVIVQNYRVIGESSTEGQDAILITRTARSTSRGEGSEGQHQVQLARTTTETGQIWIDTGSGELISSIGTTTGTVVITASGQRQNFAQTTRITITSIH